MIRQVLATSFISIGIGYLCQVVQTATQSQYLNEFLEKNLISLLIALLAINSATMGIVLTKVRELIDRNGGGADFFDSTRRQMLLSIKEQVFLIIIAAALLTLAGSQPIASTPEFKEYISTAICAIFAYSLWNLYDTAKSVLIIIDYD